MSGTVTRRGLIHLGDEALTRLRLVARVLATVTIVGLGLAAALGLLPQNPEGEWLRPAESQIQLALLAVAALAVVIAGRWAALAAVLLALAGAGLGVLAGVAYPPWIGVLVALGLLGPAVLLWLSWQHDQTWLRIGALAAVTALVLGVATVGAVRLHDRFFGPAHPQSSTPALEGSTVRWAWPGAVTSTSFAVTMAPERADVGAVGLLVGTPGEEPRLVDEVAVGRGVARLEATGLQPDTSYEYRFVLDGEPDAVWVGNIDTFPGPAEPVVLAFASCARTGTNGAVFDALRAADPDLFVQTGDLHYRDIDIDDLGAFERAYDTLLTAPAIAALLREVPMAYVWDDHDYGGNDSDGSAASRPAARSAYEATVPHYPLLDDRTINQAFDVGDVRVLLSDGRSSRDPDEQTMLGFDQLAWLESELLAAADRPLVIWVSPSPWIAEAQAGADIWAGYPAERRQLAQFLVDHDIDNLLIVTGDAHMVAIDDGSSSGYAGAPGPPVLAAASLDRPGNTKGGPYSEGMFPGAGQYGLVTYEPAAAGRAASVTLEGWRWDGTLVVSLSRPLPG